MSDETRPLYVYELCGGAVVFDEARRELTVQGQRVKVEPRALAVLSELLAADGRVMTKDELLDAIWGERQDDEPTEGSLQQAVRKLRRALTAEHEGCIVTVFGAGYRFDVARGAGLRRTSRTLPRTRRARAKPPGSLTA